MASKALHIVGDRLLRMQSSSGTESLRVSSAIDPASASDLISDRLVGGFSISGVEADRVIVQGWDGVYRVRTCREGSTMRLKLSSFDAGAVAASETHFFVILGQSILRLPF